MKKEVDVDTMVKDFVKSMITTLVDRAVDHTMKNVDFSHVDKKFVTAGGMVVAVKDTMRLLFKLNDNTVDLVDKIIVDHLLDIMNMYMKATGSDVGSNEYTKTMEDFTRFAITIIALFKHGTLNDFKKKCSLNFSDEDIQTLMKMKTKFINDMKGVSDMDISKVMNTAQDFSSEVAEFFETHGKS